MSLVYLLPYLLQEIITLLYFPVWWYTKGAIAMFQSTIRMISYGAQVLAIGIWLKNWGTPMFGQDDWQGRIISFFMRTVQIFVRTILMIIWTIIMVLFYVLYITLPIWSLVQLIMSIVG